jgi:hypothetical protein
VVIAVPYARTAGAPDQDQSPMDHVALCAPAADDRPVIEPSWKEQ